MKTVAVAARTMDRQRRYQSLLSAGDYHVLSALDCITLARLAKSRPVDIIIFDLQHPAISARDWLATIDRDPELTCLPTVWVGRDVLPGIYDRIKTIPNSITITARPDAQTLVQAIQHVCDSAKEARKKHGDTGPLPKVHWQPGEAIIDQALSIFDQPVEDTPASSEPAAPVPKVPNWQVSEVQRAGNGQKENRHNGKTESEQTETAQLAAEPVQDDSGLKLDVEEVATGKFATGLKSERDTSSKKVVIPEKIIPDDTSPKSEGPADHSQGLVDRITSEVVAQLADRLAKELISRINPEMVRRMVEKKVNEHPSNQLADA